MKSENVHLFKNAENSLLTFIKNPETYVPQKVTNTCIVGLEILHLREKCLYVFIRIYPLFWLSSDAKPSKRFSRLNELQFFL